MAVVARCGLRFEGCCPALAFQRRLSSADFPAQTARPPHATRGGILRGPASSVFLAKAPARSAHTYFTAAAFPTLRRHSDLTICGAAHSHVGLRLARGPSNPHVDPLIRAWAVPPTLHISGLRATERVTARNSGFACAQHATTGTVAPKTQTTSPLTARFQCFSPRWSAVWAPQHCKPRPRRHQSGGIARHGGPTRRRHAARGLRVVQNPRRPPVWRTPVARRARPQYRLARKNSPNTTPPVTFPRKSSPSKRKNAEFGPI